MQRQLLAKMRATWHATGAAERRMRPNKVWLRTARGRVVDIDCMAPGGDVWRMYREHTVESARLTTVTDASAGPARGSGRR